MVDRFDGVAVMLTSTQVCERTGATYRQLDYWTRAGYITPQEIQKHNKPIKVRLSPEIIKEVVADRRSFMPVMHTVRRLGISEYAYYKALHQSDATIPNYTKGVSGAAANGPSENSTPMSPGSGYGRGWTEQECHVIGRMVRMVDAGLAPERAAVAARQTGRVELGPGLLLIIEDLP